jgi:hypothetical protein
VAAAITYFSLGMWYSKRYGQFRETAQSIANVLAAKRQELSSIIDPLRPTTDSVCTKVLARGTANGYYGTMNMDKTALVNWRPMTVRLAGYLGGMYDARDGVFDMDKGIQMALAQGARAFVFDIDYLDDQPCKPLLLYRDSNNIKRSLVAGDIRAGCTAIANRAFDSGNLDPVMVIVYLHRVPPGQKQRATYLGNIAAALSPLATYHLGQTEQGSFHNCRSESVLFTSPITNYQKKIIVLANVNTKDVPPTANPKDALDYWTNGRIYTDPAAVSSSLGTAMIQVPNGQNVYAQCGNANDLLNMPADGVASYAATARAVFKIALSSQTAPIEYNDVDTLMNKLGVQCVPLDVLNLAKAPEHVNTLKAPAPEITPMNMSAGTNGKDPLSFWKLAGWSRKYMDADPQDSSGKVRSIPGYTIPAPATPQQPSSRTNANGGALNIA